MPALAIEMQGSDLLTRESRFTLQESKAGEPYNLPRLPSDSQQDELGVQ